MVTPTHRFIIFVDNFWFYFYLFFSSIFYSGVTFWIRSWNNNERFCGFLSFYWHNNIPFHCKNTLIQDASMCSWFQEKRFSCLHVFQCNMFYTEINIESNCMLCNRSQLKLNDVSPLAEGNIENFLLIDLVCECLLYNMFPFHNMSSPKVQAKPVALWQTPNVLISYFSCFYELYYLFLKNPCHFRIISWNKFILIRIKCFLKIYSSFMNGSIFSFPVAATSLTWCIEKKITSNLDLGNIFPYQGIA